MRITHDSEADALYVELRRATPVDSRDIEEGVTADLDADGHVLGIEMLQVRERLGREALASVILEQLPLAAAKEGGA
jgi:uncharacterized protein YuzE